MTRRMMIGLLLALILPSLCLAEKANLGGLMGNPYENVRIPEELDRPEVYRTAGEIQKSSEYTVMVYLCGSSLERAAAASRDLMEMVTAGFEESRLNVVVMAGGAQRWYLPQIDAGATEIYQVGNQGIRPLTADGEQRNMGKAETLSMFLNYTYDTFPSEHYALIMWDHGEGSLVGVCHDSNFRDDCLNTEELRGALRDSPFSANPLDWIGFDACLMGSAEIAKALSPYARYMVASEESEPQSGWDYSFLKTLNADEPPERTGERIAKLYMEACRTFFPRVYETSQVTMACTDLSRIEEIDRALGAFIPTVKVNGETFAALSGTRRGMVSFGRNEEDAQSDFDLIDLSSMIQNLSAYGDAEKAEAVLEALKECVAVSESSRENCSGLTLYFPFYNKTMFSERGELYDELDFNGEYAAFIREFGTRLAGGSVYALGTVGRTEMEGMQKDNRTIVQLPLSGEQLAETAAAEIIALQRSEDGEGWRLAAVQAAEISPYGSLAGEYVHTNLFVTDAGGTPLYDIPLAYTERDDGLLSIPVTLTGADGSRYDARLIAGRDPATGLVTEETVYLYDEAIGGYSSRLTAETADFAAVTYTAEERKKTWYGEAGNSALRPFSEWEILRTKEYSWTPDGNCRLTFIRDRLDPAGLAVAFRITDICNTVYMSDPIPIRNSADSDPAWLLDYDDNDWVTLDKAGFGITGGMLFLRLRNITGEEIRVTVRATEINGAPAEAETELWGNGPHDGLEPDEEQPVTLMLPLEKGETIRELHLEILLADTEDQEIGKAGVVIRLTGN